MPDPANDDPASQPRHTPGPLLVFEDGHSIGIGTGDEDGWEIARMTVYSSNDDQFPDSVQMANATLYAAAPELLAACEAYLALFKSRGHQKSLYDVMEQTEKAIAKTKVQQP